MVSSAGLAGTGVDFLIGVTFTVVLLRDDVLVDEPLLIVRFVAFAGSAAFFSLERGWEDLYLSITAILAHSIWGLTSSSKWRESP